MQIENLDLGRIECTAESATVQEIRLAKQNIEQCLATLGTEDRSYAEVLLLKLDHLIKLQQAAPALNNVFPLTALRSNQSKNPAESEPAAA